MRDLRYLVLRMEDVCWSFGDRWWTSKVLFLVVNPLEIQPSIPPTAAAGSLVYSANLAQRRHRRPSIEHVASSSFELVPRVLDSAPPSPMSDEANRAVHAMRVPPPPASSLSLSSADVVLTVSCFSRAQAFIELQARIIDTTGKIKQVPPLLAPTASLFRNWKRIT